MSERLLVHPPRAESVADNAEAVLLRITQAETFGYDVYLSAIGMDISPTLNQNFATFVLQVNGNPFYPFENMTSRLAPSYDPHKFSPRLALGRSVSVELKGKMGASGAGPTSMIGTVQLLLVKPGEAV